MRQFAAPNSKPAIGFFLSALFCIAAGFASEEFEENPNPHGLPKGPYLTEPSPTGMTVRFEAPADVEAVIHYGEGDKTDQSLKVKSSAKVGYPARNGKGKVAGFTYCAIIKDLKPATKYSYSLEVGETKTKTFTFTTDPEKTDEFTFIAYGDNRTYPGRHRSVIKHFKAHNPAFILHSGDGIGKPKRGGDAGRWNRQFFEPLADIINQIPIRFVKGNHDYKFNMYEALWLNPGEKKAWYSFDYGNLHIAALDSNLKNSEHKAEMLEWFKKDMEASKATWKIVVFHHPMYNVGGYGLNWEREKYAPLFHQYGVDIALCGHAHLYERFYPMVSKAHPNVPVSWIVSAGGGAPTYAPGEHPYLVKTAPDLHYCAITIKSDSLSFKAITNEGKELDSLFLTKTGGKHSEDYLKSAKSRDEWVQPEGTPRKEPMRYKKNK